MGSPLIPNLNVEPPKIDPVGQYGKLMALQAMGQEQQLRGQQIQGAQLENQQRQIQVQDQQAMTAAMQEWDGKDINALPGLVVKHKGSAQAVLGLKKSILDQQQQISDIAKNDAETGSKNLETYQKKTDLQLGALQGAQNGPDEGLGQRILAAAQDGAQKGWLDPQHLQTVQQLAQVQDPKKLRLGLSVFEKSLTGMQTQLDTAKTQAETEKNTQQAAEAKAAAGKTQQQSAWYAAHGGAPGVPVEEQALAAWLQKNPGKTAADYEKYVKTLPINTRYNLETGGGSGAPGVGGPGGASAGQRFGMNPIAFDQAAEKYWQTGNLPPLGRGTSGIALNRSLMNRAGELHPEGSLAANSAAFKANEASLTGLQKQRDAVVAYENTAIKNLDQFLGTAKNVLDSGSPIINMPLRKAAGLAGSTDQAAFNAARQVALTEIAKVVNNPNLTGQLSDSGRQEVMGLNPDSASLKQIYKVATILKQDMANRHQSYDQQIADIKGRFGGASQSAAPAQAAPQGQGKNYWDQFPVHQ